MARLVGSVLLAVVICTSASSQPVQATTEDGRTILVHEDGTWSALETSPAPPPATPPPPAPSRTLDGAAGTYTIRYDASRWTRSPTPLVRDEEFSLTLPFGSGYASVIYEVATFPIDVLREVVLENAGQAGVNSVRVVREHEVEVDGGTVARIEYEVLTPQDLNVTFINSLYSGDAGTIQVITWTPSAIVDRFRDELVRFHDGLKITSADAEG